MADGYNITRYRPTNDRAVYASIMNSEKVQALLLEKAKRMASEAREISTTTGSKNPIKVECDVRAGKMRAHARVYARKQAYTDTSDLQKSFATRGHNLRIDRILQASIDAAKE